MCDHHLHGLTRISPPGDRGAEELRMQRRGVERYPQQRHSGGDRRQANSSKLATALGKLARRLEQPVGDVFDCVVTRTPFGRPRHPLDDANMLGQKGGRSRLSRCVDRPFRESAGHRRQTWTGGQASASAEKVASGGYYGASPNQRR
jgi:hypothetical protein